MTIRHLVLGMLTALVLAAASSAQEVRNQLQNSSFEQDWLESTFLQSRRFSLLGAAESGYAVSDGKIDHWESPVAAWDEATAHSGRRSIRLGARSPVKQISQGVRYAMRPADYRNTASGQSDFTPMDDADKARVEPRIVHGGAWIKADGVPDGKAWIDVHGTRVPVPPGTYDWQYVGGRTAAPVAACNELRLGVTCQEGSIWVDDAVLGEEVDTAANLAVNGGFELLDRAGWPEGHSPAEPYWYYPFDYYIWTGWGHDGGYGEMFPDRYELVPGYRPRGGAAVDALVRHSGRASLRMVAYPGDAFCVMGPPVELSQPRAQPLEVGCWARADSILNIDIGLFDPDSGQYVVAHADQLPYIEGVGLNGAKGQGTYEWTYFRKLICPRQPLKKARPFVAVRGFDSRIIEKNFVGTVWFDDLEVFERGTPAADLKARGLRPAATPSPAPDNLIVARLDLGDRYWGDNELVAVLANPTRGEVKAEAELSITSPTGKKQQARSSVAVKAGADARVVLPYRVEEGCQGWAEQYRLELSVSVQGKARTIATAFGVPSSLLFTRLSHTYAFPEEKPVIAANILVSRKSLGEVGRLELLVLDPEGQATVAQTVSDPGKNLPVIVPGAEQIKYLNRDRLVTLAPDVSKLKVRPWNEATRDYTVTVRLVDRNGKEMVRAESGKFGRMEHFPASDINAAGKVSVNDEHFILIDGKPVFPVYFGEYGDTFRPEEGINLTRDQIKELGANIGTGEWDLNDLFKLTPEQVAQMAAEARAKAPGRLLVSQYDLVSHYGSCNPKVARMLLPAFDILCMEASFASHVPNLRVDYFPAMQGKNCALLVGFENYYFVPYDGLRYRAYLSVMRGAAGLGLIPSRMMEGWPECNNYLRGLNAECRALAPVFASPSPPQLTTCSDPTLYVWEKLCNGKRYLFAVRGEPYLTRGLWEWVDAPAGGPAKAHTERADPLMTQHMYQNGRPVPVPKGAVIQQEVFIEGAAPKMIALQFRTKSHLDNTWEHRAYWGATDLERYHQEATYPMDLKAGPRRGWRAWTVVENPAQPINFAADRGAFYFEVLGGIACKAKDGTASMRKMGEAPAAGKWVTLAVPAGELGLEGQMLDGICFTVDGGKALWGRTVLRTPGQADVTLIDGSLDAVAVDPGAKPVTFTVPGARQVDARTVYENRKLKVEGGAFSDVFEQPFRARLYEVAPK